MSVVYYHIIISLFFAGTMVGMERSKVVVPLWSILKFSNEADVEWGDISSRSDCKLFEKPVFLPVPISLSSSEAISECSSGMSRSSSGVTPFLPPLFSALNLRKELPISASSSVGFMGSSEQARVDMVRRAQSSEGIPFLLPFSSVAQTASDSFKIPSKPCRKLGTSTNSSLHP